MSRKGFDSGYGGVASPILEDGTMVSLPIPAARSHTRYGDIHAAGTTMGELTEHLTGGRIKGRHLAHLDPDLDVAALPRSWNWRAGFGQESAALSHLRGAGVGPGDVFLFFGWFQDVERVNGTWRHKPGPGKHVIFGWLQVDEELRVGDRLAEFRESHPWLARHPHLNAHAHPTGNAVYIATEELIIDGVPTGLPGASMIPRFRPELQLTRVGERLRSNWCLPSWFAGLPALTYHGDVTRWADQGEQTWLRVVGRGQEFVLDCAARPHAGAWLAGLLGGAAPTAVTTAAA